MLIQLQRKEDGLQIDASASEQQIDGACSCVGVAWSVPVGIYRIGLGVVGGSEERIVVDFGSNFGWESSEEGRAELGVYIGTSCDLVDSCGLGGFVEGTTVAEVGSGSHCY
jgi:hypothetical protein